MFKKKSLKFTNEKFSRDDRRNSTLKARESSRFKRFSMIRSINDSELCDEKSSENDRSVECEVQKENKKPMSRLEMLYKFRQEKQLKRELEINAKKKPFYVGASKTAQGMPYNMPNTSFNVSKFGKSKLISASTTLQPNRIPNTSKQLISGSCQLSRIPSNAKKAGSIPKVNINEKASLAAKSKPNNMKTVKVNVPLKPINQAASIPKVLNNNGKAAKSTPNNMKAVKHINQVPAAIPKFTSNALSKGPVSKGIPVQKVQSKAASIPKVLNNNGKTALAKSTPNSIKAVKTNGSLKPINQVPAAIPKFTSNALSKGPVSKGIPVQKVQSKETHPTLKNITPRKGYCFKTAAKNSHDQQTGTLIARTIKHPDEEVKNLKIKHAEEQLLENIPEGPFNVDISIIKSTSFAPNDFKFQPPELANFTFDEEEVDPCELYKQVALKFMSRTSTPTKPPKRSSPSKDSACDDNSFVDMKKSSTDKIVVNEEINNELVDQDICDTEIVNGKCNELSKSLFNEKELFKDAAANEVPKKYNDDVSLKINGNQSSVSVKCNETETIYDGNMSFDDSFLDIDVNEIKNMVEEHIQLIRLEDEELDKDEASTKSAKRTSSPKNGKSFMDISKSLQVSCIESSNNEIVNSNLIHPEPLSTDNIVINQENNNELANQEVFDITTKSKSAAIECNASLRSSFEEKKLFEDSIKNEDIEQNSDNVSLNNDSCESLPCIIIKNEELQKSFKESVPLEDSLFGSEMRNIAEEQIQLITLDDEEINKEDNPEEPKTMEHTERKTSGAIKKRVSILKSVSTMNVIAETSETDSDFVFSPRRSKRLSTRQHHNVLSEKIIDLDSPLASASITPRRSLRLQTMSKLKSELDDSLFLPQFDEKISNSRTRRSMNLIHFDTPEKGESRKKNLSAAFEKLNMNDSENMDPNLLVLDFESPGAGSKLKSKKISLLYTPEKRKSIRKSIRGDLMAFSPSSD